MIEMNRRTAMGWSLAAAATGLTSGMAGTASAKSPKEPFFKGNGLPVGLQLYTLGDALRSDLDGQLAQVAKIGYRAVELAGYLRRTPAELRAAFDKAGVACTSAHVQAKGAGGDPSFGELDRVIADSHVIGFKHVVMPMFAIPAHVDMKPKEGESRGALLGRLGAQITADDWKATADFLNAKAKVLKAAGLTTAYHNHNVEFAPVGGATGLEILLKNTDPALVQFEMDAGWVVAAGADPIALMKAHPGRFKMMHVKDVKASTKPNFAFQQDPTEVGSGIIDWKKLLAASYAAGVRDYFVEQEPPFEKPRLDAIKISFDYLNTVVA
jgi:sugar phosphate isomerase/epimerase